MPNHAVDHRLWVHDLSSLQQGLPRPGASAAARQHPQGGCYQPVGRLAGLHGELPLPASASQVMSTWARPLQLAQLELEAGPGPSLLGQRARQWAQHRWSYTHRLPCHFNLIKKGCRCGSVPLQTVAATSVTFPIRTLQHFDLFRKYLHMGTGNRRSSIWDYCWMQCDTDLHICSEMNTTPLCSAELNIMCQSFIQDSFNNAIEY